MNKTVFLKRACICLAALLALFTLALKFREEITVSNTVGGRELPIYCVETDKKVVALTFDAACGGGNLR